MTGRASLGAKASLLATALAAGGGAPAALAAGGVPAALAAGGAAALAACGGGAEAPAGGPGAASREAPAGGAAVAEASGRATGAKGPERLVGALHWKTLVYERPGAGSRPIGHLRAGALVAAAGEPTPGEGCAGGFQPIAPRGFVCLGPASATNERGHELLRALAYEPEPGAVLPYRYGLVRRPGPVYGRLPTREQAEASEPGLADRMAAWARAEGEEGASFRAELWLKPGAKGADGAPALALWERGLSGELPSFLAGGRAPPAIAGLPPREGLVALQMRKHNGFALTDTVVFEGRRYALTPDLMLVPVDRLRPVVGSTSRGVELPREVEMPFAIVRSDDAFAYRREGGSMAVVRPLARWTKVKLSGKQSMVGGKLYYEADEGYWLSDRQASRLDPAKKMPGWAEKGERWLDVNVTKQTLVAYEGTRPVYATLVSTGEAGLGDPETTRSTKRGIFRVYAKYRTTTMDSDETGEEFELRDVPYVQYFHQGYALHAAYWHDRFGTPKSHGCINLTPSDAKWLFAFTSPDVPPGWHEAREPLRGTVVFVHP
ncbi:MAG TPA: L,D-transpeptidase [Polyangiaceae bacterium]|nr:L,D-transpeptidase [Polyangiaceae bacterium]